MGQKWYQNVRKWSQGDPQKGPKVPSSPRIAKVMPNIRFCGAVSREVNIKCTAKKWEKKTREKKPNVKRRGKKKNARKIHGKKHVKKDLSVRSSSGFLSSFPKVSAINFSVQYDSFHWHSVHDPLSSTFTLFFFSATYRLLASSISFN